MKRTILGTLVVTCVLAVAAPATAASGDPCVASTKATARSHQLSHALAASLLHDVRRGGHAGHWSARTRKIQKQFATAVKADVAAFTACSQSKGQ
jgi:hypothetical protein